MRIRWLIWGAFGIGIVGMSYTRLSSQCGFYMRSVSSWITYPLLKVNQWYEPIIVDWCGRRTQVDELQQELEVWKKKSYQLQAELIAHKAQQQLYDEVKELHEWRRKNVNTQGRIVQVLMRQLTSKEQFFLVDAGARHGIQKGMIATYCNGLVGRVVEVYPWYSKVMLATDKSCKVAVQGTQSNIRGIYEGQSETAQALIKSTQRFLSIPTDELFLSTGEGLVYPRGFAVGSVVRSYDDGLCTLISIKPIYDLKAVRHCLLSDRV